MIKALEELSREFVATKQDVVDYVKSVVAPQYLALANCDYDGSSCDSDCDSCDQSSCDSCYSDGCYN